MTATTVKNAAPRAVLMLMLVGGCLLSGTIPAAALAPNPWKVYTYAEQGFSASFPIEPKKSADKTRTSFDASVASGSIQYTVAVSDDPGTETPQATLDGITRKYGDKVKSQRDIELQGYPGRELVLEFENKGVPLVITNRIYIVNNRRYQTLVTSLKSKQEEAQSKKFLDSFKLSMDAPK
jgi:hypothetical protein